MWKHPGLPYNHVVAAFLSLSQKDASHVEKVQDKTSQKYAFHLQRVQMVPETHRHVERKRKSHLALHQASCSILNKIKFGGFLSNFSTRFPTCLWDSSSIRNVGAGCKYFYKAARSVSSPNFKLRPHPEMKIQFSRSRTLRSNLLANCCKMYEFCKPSNQNSQ